MVRNSPHLAAVVGVMSIGAYREPQYFSLYKDLESQPSYGSYSC